MLVLRFWDGLSLRATEGRLEDLLGLLGHQGSVPGHTTVCKRVTDTGMVEALEAFLLEVTPHLEEGSSVEVLADSTGLTIRAPGRYYAEKHGDKRRGTYLIFHVMTNAATGEILTHQVTPSTPADGEPPIGDAPAARRMLPALVSTLLMRDLRLGALLGDGAYDDRRMYVLLHDLGAALREGYHRRSSVEGDIGTFKQCLSDRVRSKCWDRVLVEVRVKVALFNVLKRMTLVEG